MIKLKHLIIVICAVVAAGVIALCSCTSESEFLKDYTEYYTEDGLIHYTTTSSDYGAYGYITIGGVSARAVFYDVAPHGVCFEVAYNENFNIDDSYVYDTFYGERYAVGSFDIAEDDGGLYVYDFYFCGIEYDYIRLYENQLNTTTADARDYYNCVWATDDTSAVSMVFNRSSEIDILAGSVVTDDGSTDIRLKWCDGQRFEIYNGEQDATEWLLYASGYYTNVATELTLTFEYDSVFGLTGQTVNLTGTVD
ncbi:MAG: hypothetical protein LUF82_01215 [Clostridia bacterium]|nr:hypothetical protein [Clostridia bacterium]